MSGHLLLKAKVVPASHLCKPIGSYGSRNWTDDYPLGSIWQCDCGQCHEVRWSSPLGTSLRWAKISERRARRLLHKAAKSRGLV